MTAAHEIQPHKTLQDSSSDGRRAAVDDDGATKVSYELATLTFAVLSYRNPRFRPHLLAPPRFARAIQDSLADSNDEISTTYC